MQTLAVGKKKAVGGGARPVCWGGEGTGSRWSETRGGGRQARGFRRHVQRLCLVVEVIPVAVRLTDEGENGVEEALFRVSSEVFTASELCSVLTKEKENAVL